SVANWYSVGPRPMELVADQARHFHRQTHAEMPRNGAHFVAIDGPTDAVNHADQETDPLFDLLLVSTLRRTIALHARGGAEISRTDRRNSGREATGGSERTTQSRAALIRVVAGIGDAKSGSALPLFPGDVRGT